MSRRGTRSEASISRRVQIAVRTFTSFTTGELHARFARVELRPDVILSKRPRERQRAVRAGSRIYRH
ncbi:hypothetical protein [Haloarcula mannanilytica]|uniref:hypothetical protein n=1 Tax=Haloarcula mannanilytica TaxID=2509225 RepID=UPI0010F46ADC|nr:hypothetical protein [Haloarcula mannanilytica]